MDKLEKLNALKQLLDSVEWNEYIVPQVQQWYDGDLARLSVVRKAEEKELVSDDFLRGRMDVYKFLLFAMPRQLEELERAVLDEQLADEKATENQGQPLGAGDPYAAEPLEGQPFNGRKAI